MTTFFWTDDQLNKYKNGVVTSYAPPSRFGFPQVYWSTRIPGGDILAFGATERRTGGEDAWGWRVASDLTVINDFWGPMTDLPEGAWEFPDNTTFYDTGSEVYDGSGVVYDPVTDKIVMSTVITRTSGPPLYTTIAQHTILRWNIDGTPFDSDTSSNSGSPDFINYQPSGSFQGEGVGVLGRKFYFGVDDGLRSIAEVDLDTGAFRFSRNCFPFSVGTLQFRNNSVYLGTETPIVGTEVKISRFAIESIPWGSDGVAAVPDDVYVLWDNAVTSGQEDAPLMPMFSFAFIDDTNVIYQAEEQDQTTFATWPSFWQQELAPGSVPVRIHALPADWFTSGHSEAYNIWVTEEVPSGVFKVLTEYGWHWVGCCCSTCQPPAPDPPDPYTDRPIDVKVEYYTALSRHYFSVSFDTASGKTPDDGWGWVVQPAYVNEDGVVVWDGRVYPMRDVPYNATSGRWELIHQQNPYVDPRINRITIQSKGPNGTSLNPPNTEYPEWPLTKTPVSVGPVV